MSNDLCKGCNELECQECCAHNEAPEEEIRECDGCDVCGAQFLTKQKLSSKVRV